MYSYVCVKRFILEKKRSTVNFFRSCAKLDVVHLCLYIESTCSFFGKLRTIYFEVYKIAETLNFLVPCDSKNFASFLTHFHNCNALLVRQQEVFPNVR